jgi:hypothetical protein
VTELVVKLFGKCWSTPAFKPESLSVADVTVPARLGEIAGQFDGFCLIVKVNGYRVTYNRQADVSAELITLRAVSVVCVLAEEVVSVAKASTDVNETIENCVRVRAVVNFP